MRRWRRLETNGKFIAAIIISFAVFKSFISSSMQRQESTTSQQSRTKFRTEVWEKEKEAREFIKFMATRQVRERPLL